MTPEVVIDSSVAAAWLLRDEATSATSKQLEVIIEGKQRLIVPQLWTYEMSNLLRSAVLTQRISEPEAFQAWQLLLRVPMTKIPENLQDMVGVLRVSFDFNLSVYDATYVHLAQTFGCRLLTLDKEILKLRKKLSWIEKP